MNWFGPCHLMHWFQTSNRTRSDQMIRFGAKTLISDGDTLKVMNQLKQISGKDQFKLIGKLILQQHNILTKWIMQLHVMIKVCDPSYFSLYTTSTEKPGKITINSCRKLLTLPRALNAMVVTEVLGKNKLIVQLTRQELPISKMQPFKKVIM